MSGPLLASGQARFRTWLPTRIFGGAGSAGKAARIAADTGIRKAILVSDRGLEAAARTLAEALGPLHACTFLDVEPDTGVEIIDRATELARRHSADGVVSLGGGSVMDTAKGVAAALKTEGSVRPLIGTGTMKGKTAAPHLGIPTTAGTGSEVTCAAVIRDGAAKLVFWDDALYPAAAILDPLLTLKLPARLTAATGMDALTHAVEAVHSLSSGPLTDALALHAVSLISGSLREAVHLPGNPDARMSMLVASNLAGQAISNAFLGSVHALAHSVGAHCRVHHGTANAILLPHVMRMNLELNPEFCAPRYAAVGRALGVPHGSPEELSLRAVQRIGALIREVDLPSRLRDVNVPPGSGALLAEGAMADISHRTNPVPMTRELFEQLAERAW